MAIYFMCSLSQILVVLISCTAAIVADSANLESPYKTSQYNPSYYPGPHSFQNEQLYHAYFVIQHFKNTITCDPRNITSTWTGHDICGKTAYLGFNCMTPSGNGNSLTVTSVVFNGFDLCAPKLEGFINQLPDLALFQASSNNFGGDIPNLDALPYMYKLELRDNSQAQLTFNGGGNIEADTCKGWLRYCAHVRTNPHVKFPPKSALDKEEKEAIPDSTNGKSLLLNNNNLSGPLPANLGFSKLSYLALANNKLTGPIPSSIAHLQDTLQEVLLLNNKLSGCLPDELGMLTKAAVIDAGMNQLTGQIPSSFSCLSSVEQLNLAGNRVYGQVPDALCKLSGPAGRLANLTLSSNYFTSIGPACSALIKDGVLDVKNNCIPGFANQRGPAECASFLSQAKTCPAASAHVSCHAADAKKNAVAPEGRVAKDYSSYVTYATLHE